jgi:excisionase family DNA binding protein
MAEKFYTTGEVAAAIGVSRQTLQTWIAEGKVGAPKVIGNTRVWNESHVLELRRLNRNRKGRGPKPRKKT